MKNIFLIIIGCLCSLLTTAQEAKLYNPEANAEKDIAAAIKKANAEGKYVLIQAGGNWCKWCIEFARFAKADAQIDSVIKTAYVWYHLNYSKENTNKAMFAKLQYPQRFGYPAFIILNGKGQRIHTQNSEYLEDGKGSYDKRKVQSFLEMWSPWALNPAMYGEKK
ncbi:thioredoxin family protein [Ferruginibacter yonginensis]|uniref:Thioredoxin family protein n=1 Tax=Ferruginibacter yonginensis TaxID=1310416 RepID=A0ABV8QTN4_9BACT